MSGIWPALGSDACRGAFFENAEDIAPLRSEVIVPPECEAWLRGEAAVSTATTVLLFWHATPNSR